MIITTTPSVEGKQIMEYKGIVFGEVVSGVNFVRDIAASFRNILGGRSGSYEEELVMARQNALRKWNRGLQIWEQTQSSELILIMRFLELTTEC